MKSINMMAKTIFFVVVLCGLARAQTISSGYIDVDNGKVFYETAGSGPVLVFIHDGLIHREVWDNQFSFFSKNYKVVRYDRRGFGKSSAANGTFSNVEDLHTLFTQLHIDSACLIGASAGGWLAIDFTLHYPRKVNSLVLVGAVVDGLPYTQHLKTRGGHLPSKFKDFQEIAMYYVSDDPYEIYYKNTAAREKAKELVRNNPGKGHGSGESAPSSVPGYRRLNEIKVPALILVGEFDMPDVHAHAGAINAGIMNSTRDIIPKSGHLVPLEQPVLLNEAVMKFFDGLKK
jgi:pimeloyl-ACP methyl ester carboxylesterase